MHDTRSWRRSYRLGAFASVGVVALLLGCQDASAPANDDEWASTVVDNIHIRNEMQLFRADGSTAMTSIKLEGAQPSHTLPVVDPIPGNQPSNVQHVRFVHSRAKSGELITHAFVFAGLNKPPRRVYTFRNGRVQHSFSPAYRKVGRSWLRDSAHIQLYDDGKVIAAFHSRPDKGSHPASVAGDPQPFAAESVAADGLIGNEVEKSCWRELSDNLIAYAAMATTVYVAAQLMAKCPADAQATDACGTAVAAALTAALTAAAKYTQTMDALIRCEFDAWLNETNGTGSPPPAKTAETDVVKNLLAPIKEFIRQAIAAGSFWCNSDGSYCTYTGAQQL